MEIQRVTRTDSLGAVEPLLREYVAWVFDGAQVHFGARFADRDAQPAPMSSTRASAAGSAHCTSRRSTLA